MGIEGDLSKIDFYNQVEEEKLKYCVSQYIH